MRNSDIQKATKARTPCVVYHRKHRICNDPSHRASCTTERTGSQTPKVPGSFTAQATRVVCHAAHLVRGASKALIPRALPNAFFLFTVELTAST